MARSAHPGRPAEAGDGWTKLGARYAKSGVALVIGAGVSAGCGLPDWNGLLGRIARRRWGTRAGRSLFRKLRRAGWSLPAVAALLEADGGGSDDFAAVVRDALYETFPPRRDEPVADVERWRNELVRFVRRRGRKAWTLRAVAAFCTRREAGAYVANPRVHAIVSLNLDSLMQQYSRDRYGRILLRTIERPSARVWGLGAADAPAERRIPIYHVHGYLRFDWHWQDPRKGAPDVRVLTEQDYFDFFNNPNRIFNYTFLHLLREYICVFIGLSLTDENLRRLLHYSFHERVRSYHREGAGRREALRKSLRHFAILQRTSPAIDDALTRSLGRLGVRPAWCDDYGELPGRLGSVYDFPSPSVRWQEVCDLPVLRRARRRA